MSSPNSPYINLVYHNIRDVIYQPVYQSQMHNIDKATSNKMRGKGKGGKGSEMVRMEREGERNPCLGKETANKTEPASSDEETETSKLKCVCCIDVIASHR